MDLLLDDSPETLLDATWSNKLILSVVIAESLCQKRMIQSDTDVSLQRKEMR